MINLKYAIKIFTLLLLISSCKKEKETVTVTEVPPAPEEPVKVKPIKSRESTANFIAAFIAKKKQVQSKLTSLSPDEANALYETYKKENDSSLVILENYEANILENYYSYYSDEHGNATNPPDSVAQKVKLLDSAGLEYWGVGEGFIEIRTLPEYYLAIFKDKVSADYKDYIALIAKDDKDLYAADAGIVISFADVAERVINWENFIAKHPYSRLTPKAIEMYKDYQNGFLTGMDNTPTYDSSTNTFYPENIAAFKKFVKKYPDSPTTIFINMIIDFKGTEEALNKKVHDEQTKYIDKLITNTTPDYY